MVDAGRAPIAPDAAPLDRGSVTELLSGHCEMAGLAQVAGVLVNVLATKGEGLNMVDTGGERDAISCIASLAKATGAGQSSLAQLDASRTSDAFAHARPPIINLERQLFAGHDLGWARGSSMEVTVDRDFARFGNKSYAINKINSVEIRQRNPHGKGGAVVAGLLAFLAFPMIFGAETTNGKLTAAVVVAVLAFIAWHQWQKAKLIEYSLYLMTSSSEAQAYKSMNRDDVLDLRDRIEIAMSGRA